MNTAVATFASVVLAITLSALGIALDDMDDARAEFDLARAREMADQAQALEERMERHAVVLCRVEHGPNTGARWTPDGQLVCITRRGDLIASARP